MIGTASLQKFRNHGGVEFDLGRQVIFVGQNGIGKTNLLEAIYLGIRGEGFRGNDYSLVQRGKDWARVDLQTKNSARTVKLVHDKQVNKTSKKLEIDGIKKSTKDFRKDSAVVLFEPNILRMLSGPPELRRTWIDSLISQIDPVYEDSLKRYKRALFQRNNLLKKLAGDDELFVWELKLGEYGQKLVESRGLFFDELNELITQFYGDIAQKNDVVTIEYGPQNQAYASWLINELQARRGRDKLLGFTSTGPHRDDFIIKQNGNAFSDIGSRGELRSMVLALKFYELQLLEKRLGVKPVLLLDDVFSELDADRRKSLLDTTKNYQSIFTTTDTPDFIDDDTKIINLTTQGHD